MNNYSITQNGGPLDKSRYIIDLKAKTVSTTENFLVLDFSDIHEFTFKTGYNCTFKTDSNCTFKTGHNCAFNTGSDCAFNTGSHCAFNTGSNCTLLYYVSNGKWKRMFLDEGIFYIVTKDKVYKLKDQRELILYIKDTGFIGDIARKIVREGVKIE